MSTIISIANQKGGTGKTTTTIVLSYLLARKGVKVLAIDLDPQASLTLALRTNPGEVEGIDAVLMDCLRKYADYDAEDFEWDGSLDDVVRRVNFMGCSFDFVPANQKLEDVETQLKSVVDGDSILSWTLKTCEDDYEVILVDNRPALDWLVVNSLTASDYVLAPVELSTIALGGFAELLKTVARVKRKFNENLNWLGVLPVKFEKRNKDMNEKLRFLHEKLGSHIPVFPPVPKSVSLERMLHLNSAEELLKNVKSAKNVLNAYEKVVERILELQRR